MATPGFHFDPQPPPEAMRYIRGKGWKVGFDYRDVWREEHATAFTVAKAMTQDVLSTIRDEVTSALEEGRPFAQFKKELQPKLESLGWWGVKEMTDPKTGEDVQALLGSPRRLRVIYRANLRTARAAGQWERIERTKATHPFLRYELGPSIEHRKEHETWAGTLLPVDDPWWNAHMPPNGWGCKCRVRQISKGESGRLGGPKEPPPTQLRNWTNKRTGEVEQVPAGIDPGWDTNPGKLRLAGLVPPEGDLPPSAVPPAPPAESAAPATSPMPPPRRADPERLMASGLAPEEYARAFLKEFGADLGKDSVHVDQTGMPVVVSEALFRAGDGRWKAGKRRRGEMMLLLADGLREPDEIWERFETGEDGRSTLYRYYLTRWEVGDARRPALTIFRWGNAQWSGATAFGPDRERYLLNQRRGELRYRREDPEN